MEKQKTIHEQLAYIQQNLKAPKGQMNDFGGYKYRSCEDIMEAVKPLLEECTLEISDEIVQIGERYYVKAIVTLTNGKDNKVSVAYARESLDKKGMDDSQITGATSSYARKYALNGLFAIDDTKDADTMDNTKHATMTTVADPTDSWAPDIEYTPQAPKEVIICPEHNVEYRKFEKNGREWYSHKVEGTDGWCNRK